MCLRLTVCDCDCDCINGISISSNDKHRMHNWQHFQSVTLRWLASAHTHTQTISQPLHIPLLSPSLPLTDFSRCLPLFLCFSPADEIKWRGVRRCRSDSSSLMCVCVCSSLLKIVQHFFALQANGGSAAQHSLAALDDSKMCKYFATQNTLTDWMMDSSSKAMDEKSADYSSTHAQGTK